MSRWFVQLFAPLRDARRAQQRAHRLLIANLTDAQLSQLKQFAFFEVVGGATGARYRIHDAPSINVEQMDQDNRPVTRWCFLPEGELARGDVLLAQKIALELFEREALRIAHRHATLNWRPTSS